MNVLALMFSHMKLINRLSMIVTISLLFWHLIMPASLWWLTYPQAIGLLFWLIVSLTIDHEVLKNEKHNTDSK